MMIPFMSMNATNLSFAGAGGAMAANQGMMGLANSATGNESQADVASLAAQDKALHLEGIQGKTQYTVSQALQGTAEEMKKKRQEQQQRNIQNGMIFG